MAPLLNIARQAATYLMHLPWLDLRHLSLVSYSFLMNIPWNYSQELIQTPPSPFKRFINPGLLPDSSFKTLVPAN